MKILTICALLVMSCGLFAANGEKQVGELTFVLQEGVWVQQGLEEANLPSASAVVHQSTRWQSWHAQGSETLRQILELGPAVVFQAPSRDGETRVFSVHADGTSMKGAVDRNADSTAGLMGNALLVGATMSRGGGEASPSTP